MSAPLRVIIIEDSSDDLDLILHELTQGGYAPDYRQVQTAQQLDDALNTAEWDIILSDYSLPDFSAPAALKALKKSGKDIAFIVVSGNVGEDVAVQLMQFGCSDYIDKNKLTRLCPAIQREILDARARAQHRESRALTDRLWNILDNSLNEIYIFDAQTLQFKILNQGALNNLGYTKEEALALHPYDIKPEYNENEFVALIQPLLSGETSTLQFETIHQRKNGSTYPVSVNLQLSSTEGDPVFYAIMLDISDRVKASREIETLARFPQENPQPVIRLDLEAQVHYANPVGQYVLEEWNKTFGNESPKHWQAMINECIRENRSAEFEETLNKKVYLWLLSPSDDRNFVNCYARDITKQRAAEQNLRQAAQVFDNSIEGIMITDANNRIVRVNPAFTTITGYSEKEVRGKNPSLLQSGKHNAYFFQSMWKELDLYGTWQGELFNKRKNHETFPSYMTISVVRNNAEEVVNFISVFADISERKKAQEHIHKLAYFDTLTNLPNRVHLHEKLFDYIAKASRLDHSIALIYLDFDRFKTLNESLGHTMADELLSKVAEKIQKGLPDNVFFGRMGGDEFLILASDYRVEDDESILISQIRNLLHSPTHINNQDIYLSASFGISHFPDDGDTVENLIKHAQTALNLAKQEGSGLRVYSENMSQYSIDYLTLESSLRKAIERYEFVLFYQPQIELLSGRIVGLEALLRWQHPEDGLVAPGVFIPLLEETGLIVPVGNWIIQEACRQIAAWTKRGIEVPRVAINLSARQFNQNNLVENIRKTIEQTGVSPKALELEVTESTIMRQHNRVVEILRELHEFNIQIAIDDFGTGYSSLSYLKHFPLDVLKIDQSFVREIPDNKDDTAIVSTIIAMGHSLNLKVIAEGVETVQQRDCLKKLGCELAQGYYYTRPLPAQDIIELIQKNKQLKTG